MKQINPRNDEYFPLLQIDNADSMQMFYRQVSKNIIACDQSRKLLYGYCFTIGLYTPIALQLQSYWGIKTVTCFRPDNLAKHPSVHHLSAISLWSVGDPALSNQSIIEF